MQVALDSAAPGYQAPLPESEVKELDVLLEGLAGDAEAEGLLGGGGGPR